MVVLAMIIRNFKIHFMMYMFVFSLYMELVLLKFWSYVVIVKTESLTEDDIIKKVC